MKIILLISSLAFSLAAQAQLFWTEGFGDGCSTGQPIEAYIGSNGPWTVESTGANDAYANLWFASATEAGMGAGNCGDGCGITPSLTNRSLHVGNAAITVVGLAADGGATYNSGGICAIGYCVATNKRAESPTIDCSGRSFITLSFNYMENGSGTVDDATLWYYDGAVWSLLVNLPKTPLTCAPQGQWTAFTAALPSSADNNPNVKIGFNWVNNDDGVGTDPSFAVDDISLSATALVCSVDLTAGILACYGDCNALVTVLPSGAAPYTYIWGSGETTASVMLCAGTHGVTITDALGCTADTMVNIAQPSPVIATDTVLANSCSGCLSGIAAVSMAGGTPPYTILWSNTQTDTLAVFLNPGDYSYTVTDNNGCTDTGTVTIEEITGVQNFMQSTSVSIYPNPFVDQALIVVNGKVNEQLSMRIYDGLGKRVRQYELREMQTAINRDRLSSGLYHWVLTDNVGQVISRGKLAVE